MKSATQVKLNPSLKPDEVGFHREAISPIEDGFIPSDRTDLVEKEKTSLPFSGTDTQNGTGLKT